MVALSAAQINPRTRIASYPHGDPSPIPTTNLELNPSVAARPGDQLNLNSDHAFKSSLGTNAEFASVAERSSEYRYWLQSLAVDLLPEEKVSDCHRFKVPNADRVKILFDQERESVHVKNLVCCDRRNICAVCAAKLTERDRKELQIAIAHSGFRAALFTYTISHHLGESLRNVYDTLKTAYKFFKAGSRWQNLKDSYLMQGSIRSREVNHGDNGWHVHIHEVVLFDAAITDSQLFDLEIQIKALWANAVTVKGGYASWDHGADMKIGDDELYSYVAKWGHEPVETRWTLEHELVKSDKKHGRGGSRNMWQLLNDYGEGDQEAGALFREYAICFKGDHPLRWSDGLKDQIGIVGGEEVDQELIDQEQEKYIELAALDSEQWSVVVETDNRAQLRKQARAGDKKKFVEWLRSIGVVGPVNFVYTHVNLNDVINSPPKEREKT